MEELAPKLPQYLSLLAQGLGSLVLVATVIVKLTPSESDNAMVKKYADIILKVISYLPTLGVNPETKKLKKAYEELSKK